MNDVSDWVLVCNNTLYNFTQLHTYTTAPLCEEFKGAVYCWVSFYLRHQAFKLSVLIFQVRKKKNSGNSAL